LGRFAHGGDQRARLALSFPLGLIGALMRVSDNRFASTVATVYVEIVRNIPLLVVLYILFLVLPLYGMPINALTAGVAALAINSTAFTIEIFRGGFAAVPVAQHDAARALGLRPALIMALVVVPQVFRIVLPTLGNQIVSVVLGSAQASIIGVADTPKRQSTIDQGTDEVSLSHRV
jgi:His/Glu/Gln/Arg/opine family amino acid ABC transporter permease subunit